MTTFGQYLILYHLSHFEQTIFSWGRSSTIFKNMLNCWTIKLDNNTIRDYIISINYIYTNENNLSSQRKGKQLREIVSRIVKSNLASTLLPIFVICIVLGFTTEGFVSSFNLFSIGKTGSITILVGLAQLMVMALGQMNLALGSMGCCSAIVTAVSMQELGMPVLLAILMGVLLGTILGAIQGILITRTIMSPFIITLSLNAIYLGLATGLTGGTIYNKIPKEFRSINNANLLGIPVLLIIATAIVLIFTIILFKTSLGRNFLATGANRRAANCAGIDTKGIILGGHSLSGMIASIAGILTITLQGSAQISIGTDWMLVSFAGPVLGGCILSGGKVSTIGMLFGAILMTMITNGLVMLDVSYFWFQTFVGAILLIAFEIDRFRSNMLIKFKVR